MQPDLDNNRNPWHAKERKLKQNTKQRIICKNPDEPWTQRTTIARHARTTTADSHKIEKTPVHDDFSPYSHGAVQRTKLSSGAERSPSRKRTIEIKSRPPFQIQLQQKPKITHQQIIKKDYTKLTTLGTPCPKSKATRCPRQQSFSLLSLSLLSF